MAISKEDFLELAMDYLLNNPEQRDNFYEDLLELLHQGDIITTADISDSVLIKQIIDNIDWTLIEDHTTGEDNYFNGENGLYTSLKEFLNKKINTLNNDYNRIDLGKLGWDEAYWNNSVAKLLQIMAQRLDLDTTKDYENSGLLIEVVSPPSDSGKIDTQHLRGGIAPEGAGVAELRIVDMLNADAANSFINENDLYEIYRFYENITINDNIGYNVLFKATAAKLLSKMEADEQLTNGEIDQLNEAIVSGINTDEQKFQISYSDTQFYSINGSYVNFKVVSEPWVVPWYNIDGDSYSRVRDSDKKISTLTNKEQLNFTRKQVGETKFIRLIMPKYKRKVEVEDLDRDFWVIGQVIDGISITLFDDNGPLKSIIEGILKEIGQLWENIIYLWLALALLSKKKTYDQTHSEVVILSYNEYNNHLKYDNFNEINTSIENCTNELNYLINKYPDYNLIIMPVIRTHNYEQNYYRAVKYPGIWVYDRNEESPEWKVYKFNDNNNNNGITIDMINYKDKSYGILEEEENYDYIYPLEDADTKSLSNKARYYNLGRDEIKLELSLVNGGLEGNASIEIKDVGEFLVENNWNNLVEYSLDTDNNGIDNVNLIINMKKNQCQPKASDTGNISISQGYYQGELLSFYKTAGLLSNEIEFIYVELMPEYSKTHMNQTVYDSIITNVHDYNSDKAINADLVLQKYFEEYIQNEADINKIYVLVGHFYYSEEANGNSHNDSSVYYYIDENDKLQQGTTVNGADGQKEIFRKGPQGVDTGFVLYVPDTESGHHNCYSFCNGVNGMWAYSDYQLVEVKETDPYKPFFRGNSAYRIELYLKQGETIRRKTNWLMKYITLACITSAASSDPSDPNKRNDNDKYVESIWNSGRYNIYCHNWGGNGHYYNINERIFSYYIYFDDNENPKLATVKLEREGIDGESKRYDGRFIETTIGNPDIINQYDNPNIQTEVEIQGVNMLHVLGKNTTNNQNPDPKLNPPKYSPEDWPQYEECPNNGFYNPYNNESEIADEGE